MDQRTNSLPPRASQASRCRLPTPARPAGQPRKVPKEPYWLQRYAHHPHNPPASQ